MFFHKRKQNPTGFSNTTVKGGGNDDSVIYSNYFSQEMCEMCTFSKGLLRAALLRVSAKI